MWCEYCDKNIATVEVAVTEDESIHLCWFCAERADEIVKDMKGGTTNDNKRNG